MRIGIDLGGTKTEGALIDKNGRVISRHRLATPRAEGYRAIVDQITSLVSELESEFPKVFKSSAFTAWW